MLSQLVKKSPVLREGREAQGEAAEEVRGMCLTVEKGVESRNGWTWRA